MVIVDRLDSYRLVAEAPLHREDHHLDRRVPVPFCGKWIPKLVMWTSPCKLKTSDAHQLTFARTRPV